MYFKAYVSLSTENLDTDGSCLPDTYQDHGVVRDFTAPTLEELKKKIEKEYFNLEKPIGADVQIFDGRIDIQYIGEHDYRTPKSEQIPFIETTSIYISKIEETYLDLANEEIFSKISR